MQIHNLHISWAILFRRLECPHQNGTRCLLLLIPTLFIGACHSEPMLSAESKTIEEYILYSPNSFTTSITLIKNISVGSSEPAYLTVINVRNGKLAKSLSDENFRFFKNKLLNLEKTALGDSDMPLDCIDRSISTAFTDGGPLRQLNFCEDSSSDATRMALQELVDAAMQLMTVY